MQALRAAFVCLAHPRKWFGHQQSVTTEQYLLGMEVTGYHAAFPDLKDQREDWKVFTNSKMIRSLVLYMSRA